MNAVAVIRLASVLVVAAWCAAGAAAEPAAPAGEKIMPADGAGRRAPGWSAPAVTAFGTLPDGREAHLYTLEVPGGWRATITDYGAILTSLHVPPRDGAAGMPVDVALGFDTLDGYLKGHPYFGATCGRCSNRIAAGTFALDGRTVTLAANNGAHHLHGGVVGFDKKLWQATPRRTDRGPAVELETVSPDGDEGYPGRLVAKVTYTLTPAGELVVEMTATTDAPTIVNLVHHSYWNLAGHAAGSIGDHELAVAADRYLPVDAGSIPTGEFAPVEGTPFDFRPERKPWGRCGPAIETVPAGAAPGTPRGVDHDFVVRGWRPDGTLRTAATLRDPKSGRSLEVLSDQPGIQVYMGNFLDGSLTGKGGAVYVANGGICLETQKHPDSIHHPEWPTVRLDPGGTYRHVMVHRFTR
jgi:aldose 1-epimerase